LLGMLLLWRQWRCKESSGLVVVLLREGGVERGLLQMFSKERLLSARKIEAEKEVGEGVKGRRRWEFVTPLILIGESFMN